MLDTLKTRVFHETHKHRGLDSREAFRSGVKHGPRPMPDGFLARRPSSCEFSDIRFERFKLIMNNSSRSSGMAGKQYSTRCSG